MGNARCKPCIAASSGQQKGSLAEEIMIANFKNNDQVRSVHLAAAEAKGTMTEASMRAVPKTERIDPSSGGASWGGRGGSASSSASSSTWGGHGGSASSSTVGGWGSSSASSSTVGGWGSISASSSAVGGWGSMAGRGQENAGGWWGNGSSGGGGGGGGGGVASAALSEERDPSPPPFISSHSLQQSASHGVAAGGEDGAAGRGGWGDRSRHRNRSPQRRGHSPAARTRSRSPPLHMATCANCELAVRRHAKMTAKLEHEHMEETSGLNREKEQLRSELARSVRQVQELGASATAAQQRVAALEHEHMEETSGLNREKEQLRSELARSVRQVQELGASATAAQQRVAALEQEQKGWRERTEAAQQQVRNG
eukprot:SAG25_NODE_1329_length_3279_cov_494.218553_2_plen_370_part_00